MTTFQTQLNRFKLRSFIGAIAIGIISGLVTKPIPVEAVFDPVNDDTDIFLANPNNPGTRPNVLLFIDNTANWNQAFTNEKQALVNVINGLGEEFNVGTMLFPETGGSNDSIDGGLPLAAERGLAVIVNRPFRRGALFDLFGRHPLPAWAAEFDCANWAQFFLKFIVSPV